MISSLLWVLSLIFCSHHAQYINKTVTINPNTPNLQDEGAEVIELNVNISENPLEWKLNATSNTGFHLQLILNESWSFHESHNSTLILQVYADGNTSAHWNDPNWHQLMVAFTQKNSNKFFTTRLYLDNWMDHNIYPQCDWSFPFEQTYTNGDVIKQIVNSAIVFTQYTTAVGGIINENMTYYPEIVDQADRDVGPPLTFILFNNPLQNYMLFTYTNPNTIARSCGFVAMQPNKILHVFFAANGALHTVDISSITITITHSDQLTDVPSSIQNPTSSNPTTSNPTTSNPTTSNPTTSNPTTSNPTTLIPTSFNPTSSNPTANPTSNPTSNPTTSNPTSSNPTTSNPTSSPTTMNATNDMLSTLMLDNNESKNDDGKLLIILSIVIGAFIICSLIIFMVYCSWSRNMKKNKRNDNIKAEIVISEIIKTQLPVPQKKVIVMDDAELMYIPQPPQTETSNTSGENNHVFEGKDDYGIIGDILKQCDPNEWEMYLHNFRKHKMTKDNLKFVNDEQRNIWMELIPELGIRTRFQSLWKESNTKIAKKDVNYTNDDSSADSDDYDSIYQPNVNETKTVGGE